MGLNTEKNMYKLPLILLIILPQLMYNVKGQQAEGFQKEPSDTEVRAGDEGRLQCILQGRDGSKCFWSRNDQEVAFDEAGRYKFTGDRVTGDCSISIAGSNFDFDDGLWACGIPQTSEVTGLKSRSARYTVLSPPSGPIIKVNGEPITNGSDIVMSMETDMQSSPKIECWSEGGNPPASLIWTLGNMNLAGNYTTVFSDSTNKTLNAVLVLTAQFDETWQNQYLACVATHGSFDQSSVSYGIVQSPQPTTTVTLTVWEGSGDIQVSTDEVVSAVCTADGYPPPELKLQMRESESGEWQDAQVSPEATNVYNFTFLGTDTQITCVASNDGWVSSVMAPTPINISTILYLEPHDNLEITEYPTNYHTATSNAQVGTIIAIVVVCVVAVVVMGAGVFTCYKKKMCLFKVQDPVDHVKHDAHDGKKDPAHLESGELFNQVPLLNEVNENQYNGNQKPASSPNGTRKDDVILYAKLNLNERGNQSPSNEQRTEYATIKPRH